MADHVKSASSMGALLILELLYIPADKVHKIYVDAITYTFNIFQLYISYHIYHICKCFDNIMHMVPKIWRTLDTSTNLVSKSGDTSPTLVPTSSMHMIFVTSWWGFVHIFRHGFIIK